MAGGNESGLRPTLGEGFIDLTAFVSAPELSGNVSWATFGVPLIESPLVFTKFVGDIPPSSSVVPKTFQACPGFSYEQVRSNDVFVLTDTPNMPTDGVVNLRSTLEVSRVSGEYSARCHERADDLIC